MPVPVFAVGEVLTAANMNQVGLWLIKTQTIGNGVGSVTVNDAFSADYQNYKIVIAGGDSSAVTNLSFNFTGTATSTYRWAFSGVNFTGATANLAATLNDSLFKYAGFCSTIDYVAANIDVLNPFAAAPSNIQAVVHGSTYGGTTVGLHSSAVSYTGFVITPESGTLTGGTIRVYGYRD
jgi:hypothetical protein